MSHMPDSEGGDQSANGGANDEPEEPGDSSPWSLDVIFEVLSTERRRHALYELYRRAEPLAVADLADAVASACEKNSERITTELHHVHLPKLAKTGVVEYDRDARTATLSALSPRLERYLAAAADDESQPLHGASESATSSEF